MGNRTAAEIREHYELEKQLAERLRGSTFEDRKNLYSEAYDELFQALPHHPMLVDYSPADKQRQLAKDVRRLETFITPETIYLEIGPGDCAVAFEVARRARKVYAVDVSSEITKGVNAPANFELIISDGTSIPVAANSIDVAFSNQLMEHLHPDDSRRQLENVYRALKPGGTYFCITPNRLSGPHDISRNFDAAATGLHLKEYTVTELDRLFRRAGFSKTRVFTDVSNILLPVAPYRIAEKTLDFLPHKVRKLLTFNKIVRFALGVKLVATK